MMTAAALLCRAPAVRGGCRLPAAAFSSVANGPSTRPGYTDRVRRALFSVPGADERKLAKSTSLKADSIVLDLEDGVALNRKGAAREMVYTALESSTFAPGTERVVRINAVGSGFELDDLNVVLRSKKIDAIVIPKVDTAQHVQFVSRLIDLVAEPETQSRIRLLAAIESAIGIMNLREIASSDPRLDALIFASEDYCASVGCVRTPSRRELMYPRSAVVTAASAFGLQAIDLVCIDYKNLDALREEAREGREMGFTGKQAIHPDQIEPIQAAFSPSEKEIAYATRIVDGFRKHDKEGIGAFALDGKVVDIPVVREAEKILARAAMSKPKK